MKRTLMWTAVLGLGQGFFACSLSGDDVGGSGSETDAAGDTEGDPDDPGGDGDGDSGGGSGGGSGSGSGDGDEDPGGDGDSSEPDPDADPYCGDGVVQNDEECDEGSDNGPNGYCDNECRRPVCGDGVVAGDESCDDGNDVDEDNCPSNCQAPTCGDGFVYADIEACDDGNTEDTDACTSACEPARCMDGFVWEGVEACDDGNAVNSDDCLNSCEPASCGDGFVWRNNEECDDQNDIDTDACVSCRDAYCGDGIIWEGVEECDDGNQDETDYCTFECKYQPVCGDDNHEPGEVCYDDSIVRDFGGTQVDLAVLDVDKNGDDELVTMSASALRTVEPIDGTLLGSSLSTGGDANALALADFNNDGHLDVGIAREVTDDVGVRVALGTGETAGPFSEFYNGPMVQKPLSDIAAGTLWDDGFGDFVSMEGPRLGDNAGEETYNIVPHRGRSTGCIVNPCSWHEGCSEVELDNTNSYRFVATLGSPQNPVDRIALAEIMGGGRILVFQANFFSDEAACFLSAGVRSPGGTPTGLLSADVDGDGADDLLVSLDNGVLIYDTDLNPPSWVDFGAPVGGMAVDDLDNDGIADLAVTIPSRQRVAVMSGDGDFGFLPAGEFAVTASAPGPIVIGDFEDDVHDAKDIVVIDEAGGSLSVLVARP